MEDEDDISAYLAPDGMLSPTKSAQVKVLSQFLVADTKLYKRLCPSVRWLVRPSVTIESKSEKMRISAPAHPSATDGHVSGLV